MNRKKYRTFAVGGTFDKLHKGHEKLIDKAFELGELVLIGLTTDKMLKSHTKLFSITRYSTRKKELIKLRWKAEKRINKTYFKKNKIKCIKSILSKSPKLILRILVENFLISFIGYYKAHKTISKIKKFIRKKIIYLEQKIE